jgi:hypothetical protein
MTAIRFTGRVELDGQALRCPSAGPGELPRQLTLMATGPTLVSATCGRKHRGPDGGRKSGCFWTVEGVTPAALQALATQAKPGHVRANLPGGKTLQGRLTAVDPTAGKAGKAGAGPAAAAHGEKTRGKDGGKEKPAPHAARNNAGGGAAQAAFMAVAAVANAVGQTAGAASNIVSSTTGLAGKGLDVAKEGVGLARDGVKAVDHTAQRDFARQNTKKDGGKGSTGGGEGK